MNIQAAKAQMDAMKNLYAAFVKNLSEAQRTGNKAEASKIRRMMKENKKALEASVLAYNKLAVN